MEEAADLRAPIKAAAAAFEDVGVDYDLFGANAQNIWGRPRYTADADFVIFIRPEDADRFLEALTHHGYTLTGPEQAHRLRTTSMAKVKFGGITIDFVVGETDFEKNVLARRKFETYLGTRLPVASAVDDILHKLIAHRGQDLVDIENIIRRQGAKLDVAYLRKWAVWLSSKTGYVRIRTTLDRLLKKRLTRRR